MAHEHIGPQKEIPLDQLTTIWKQLSGGNPDYAELGACAVDAFSFGVYVSVGYPDHVQPIGSSTAGTEDKEKAKKLCEQIKVAAAVRSGAAGASKVPSWLLPLIAQAVELILQWLNKS